MYSFGEATAFREMANRRAISLRPKTGFRIDMPTARLAFAQWLGNTRLEARCRRFQFRWIRLCGQVRQAQLREGRGPFATCLAIIALCIVDAVQKIPRRLRGIAAKTLRAAGRLAELHITPVFGPVHVDDALWRPDPVV